MDGSRFFKAAEVIGGLLLVGLGITAGIWISQKPVSLADPVGSSNVRPAIEKTFETSSVPPPRATEVDELINKAENLRTNHQLREAEILLTRAVQTNSDSLNAWRALAAVQREMAESSLASQLYLQAAQEVDRAKSSANVIKGLSINPAVKGIEPEIPLEEERANEVVMEKVRKGIDITCEECIKNALKSADDAHLSGWRVVGLGIFLDYNNDRKKVIEGLIHLKPGFLLGPWASEATRRSMNDAYSKLKALVYENEWDDLLSRAGFDPSSRDALRKWGLK